MYAVIESGGKQYRVELGSEIQVDRLEAEPGDTITLERVLLVADDEQAAIGRPFVDGAVVNADVVGQARGDKVVVFKYRPKARRRVKKGFRAALTTLRISDIAYGGTSAAKAAERDEERRREAEREAERAAAERAAADQELAARLTQAASDRETGTAAPRRARASRAAALPVGTAETPEDRTSSEGAPTTAAEAESPEAAAEAESAERAAETESAERAAEAESAERAAEAERPERATETLEPAAEIERPENALEPAGDAVEASAERTGASEDAATSPVESDTASGTTSTSDKDE